MTSRHQLTATPLNIHNFKCFGVEGSGNFSFGDITVLIGRNNSGKSSVADALRWLANPKERYDKARHGRPNHESFVDIPRELTADDLRGVFSSNTSGGEIGENHWNFGQRFIGTQVTTRFRSDLTPIAVNGLEFPRLRQTGETYKQQIAQRLPMPFKGMSIIDVAAERDVNPEGASNNISLDSNGGGLTNMVRAFINKDDLPRHEVEVELLRELNLVFQGDASFGRISCRESDTGHWEIFLTEGSKGDIRLSQSGSSLKSIFIILAKLRLEPIIKNANFDHSVLIVEEPENNLHPALLRRLLEFLALRSKELGFALIIATHSPIAIDWLSRKKEGKVLHVTSDGSNSYVTEVSEYVGLKNILDDLDIRASDLLQANGIIWVEGPSDRIYVRRWLDLHSAGKLVEGVHYTIMFYGGKLLSHLSASTGSEQKDLINTLSINRNVALVMDSDRHLGGGKTAAGRTRKPRLGINETKRRIRDEVISVKGFAWITDGREVENYIPERLISYLSGEPDLRIGMFDEVPEHPAMKHFKGDKIAIASAAAEQWTLDELHRSSDLANKVKELEETIMRWNSIKQLR
jgi:putative ATP-dependent endonuclease of OLD family